MQKVSSYKCPCCNKSYTSLATWANHLTKMHPGNIPEGFTPARYFYYLLTKKKSGSCIMCKSETQWNESSGKYERFCRNPACKEKYRQIFKNRMISKYGKAHLLNDPTKQREMLMGKRNSGYYTFNADRVKVSYASSYESDFLQMLDTFLHFNGNDIMGPSPHTYYYDYINPNDREHEGRKFYIPDYFIPSLNLEIEIKQNTNTHPKLLAIDKIKEQEKDNVMKNNPQVNYIKLTEKDYTEFFKLLIDLRETYPDTTGSESSALESAIMDNDTKHKLQSIQMILDRYNGKTDLDSIATAAEIKKSLDTELNLMSEMFLVEIKTEDGPKYYHHAFTALPIGGENYLVDPMLDGKLFKIRGISEACELIAQYFKPIYHYAEYELAFYEYSDDIIADDTDEDAAAKAIMKNSTRIKVKNTGIIPKATAVENSVDSEYMDDKEDIYNIDATIIESENDPNIYEPLGETEIPANIGTLFESLATDEDSTEDVAIEGAIFDKLKSTIFDIFGPRTLDVYGDSWHKKLFGNIGGSSGPTAIAYNPGFSLSKAPAIIIDKQKDIIRIVNLNYDRLFKRMRDSYGEKSIVKIFERTYRSNEVRRFNRKKLSRSQMRITSLETPMFFALELIVIFNDLHERYGDPIYRRIANKIYKQTWVSRADANVKNSPLLDTSKLSAILNKKYTPAEYQLEFIRQYQKLKAFLGLNGFILGFEQGLGKTLTSTCLVETLGVDRAYIVCPKTLIPNWQNELNSYYNDGCTVINCADGNMDYPADTKYFVINNEAIPSMHKYIDPSKSSIIIIDESQNFRNIDGKRVEELLDLKERIKPQDTLLMSGTPIKAIPSEITPALLLIDPHFNLRAATIYNQCFKYSSYLAMDIIQKRFGHIMYRKKKSDVLSLPPVYVDKLVFPVSDPTRFYLSTVKNEVKEAFAKFYDELLAKDRQRKAEFIDLIKKHSSADPLTTHRYLETVAVITNRNKEAAIHELDQADVKAFVPAYIMPNIKSTALKKNILDLERKLLNIKNSAMGKAVGTIYPPKRTLLFKTLFDENRDAIIGKIKDCPKKTIIFSQLVPVVEHITKELNRAGCKAVMIIGSSNDRTAILSQFMEDDTVDVLVCTSQTVGAGVTLTCASQIMFFGSPWRSTDFEQCYSRAHRIGQTIPVYVWDVIMESAEKNLSSRMNQILMWSSDMFNSAIDNADNTALENWSSTEDNTFEPVLEVGGLTTATLGFKRVPLSKELIDKYKTIQNKLNTLKYKPSYRGDMFIDKDDTLAAYLIIDGDTRTLISLWTAPKHREKHRPHLWNIAMNRYGIDHVSVNKLDSNLLEFYQKFPMEEEKDDGIRVTYKLI